ncbi:MAG TPA: PilZ domain-containing protein [Porticoccus sp.]|nr:PilZ domain-containing protein [Porticoccus sp.]
MRRFIRHPTDIPIDVKVAANLDDAESSCYMTTVSQGGLSCEVASRVRVGSTVDIDILSVSPPYHGTGEIMWCRAIGSHFEVGVRFTNLEEAFKARMVQQVCQIEHYKNIVFEREGRLLDGDQAAAEWIEKYAEEFN